MGIGLFLFWDFGLEMYLAPLRLYNTLEDCIIIIWSRVCRDAM